MRLFLLPALVACLASPQGAGAASASGAYLAARQAGLTSDYDAAARYFSRALSYDAGNPMLMENTASAQVSLGHLPRALPIAERMRNMGLQSQVADLIVLTDRVALGDFEAVIDELQNGGSVGPLVDGLVEAWSLVGAGRADDALARFDAMAEERGLQSFARSQKAYALAAMGDLEGADDILSGRAGAEINVSRRAVLAHAQILSQLGRNEDAVDLIDAAFGATPAPIFADLAARLEGGETLELGVASNPAEGVAEVFFSLAGALAGETGPALPLLYARLAEHLHPGHMDAVLMSAALLQEAEQDDLALTAYDGVARTHPSYVDAQIGRAEALAGLEREDAGVAVLRDLSDGYPDLLSVQMTLGDTLRRLERHGEAARAYNRAIALIDAPRTEHWALWFARGIAFERTDRWSRAEDDFRFALQLSPDQPQVLNYLGYSLVERREKLPEALDMIERAVAARPDDGYITDSLGWVLYRLGRYPEAVAPMERAVKLMPTDPIINDHLGDVFWAVGRRMEARFQWRRALSFDPEPEEAERIRRKLDVGLDTVLAEEEAAVDVAEDGG